MLDDDARVFVAELDDDAVRRLGAAETQRSLLAYLLLADTVVLHPAYFFQYPMAKRLILGDAKTLLSPPRLQLVLGDSADTHVYMVDR